MKNKSYDIINEVRKVQYMEEVNYSNIKEMVTSYLKTTPVIESKKNDENINNDNEERIISLTEYYGEDIEIIDKISELGGKTIKTLTIISEKSDEDKLEVIEKIRTSSSVTINERIITYFKDDRLSLLLEEKKLMSANGTPINTKVRITEKNSNNAYNTNHYDVYGERGMSIMLDSDGYISVDDTDLLNRLLILKNRISSLNDKFLAEVKYSLGFEEKVKEYKIKRKMTKDDMNPVSWTK